MTVRTPLRAVGMGCLLSAAVFASPASGGAVSAGIAGYNMTAVAAAARVGISSPGLLPVGDPTQGTLIDLGVPFARATVSSGPVVDAVASPAYPGDTVAHLGTALGTFGVPGVPDYPVVAEAQYPPSPSHGSSATLKTIPATGDVFGVGPATGDTAAGIQGAAGRATVTSASIGIPGLPAALQLSGTTAATGVHLGSTVVEADATATVASLRVAGILEIDGISGRAAVRSDGQRATPEATLHLGAVTAAGHPAYIDEQGLHLTKPAAAPDLLSPVESMIDATLAQDGVTVRTLGPSTDAHGGSGTATSGAVSIAIERTVPAASVPGLPPVPLPGAPPLPTSTPPVPLRLELVIGQAAMDLNASAGEAVLETPRATAEPEAPSPAVPLVPAIAAAGESSAATFALAAPVTAASQLPAASAVRLPHGTTLPVVWVLAGLVVAAGIAGALLDLARWQLIDGRER